MPLISDSFDVSSLPILLAGPILRRLTRTQVSVWVALSKPNNVTLHVDHSSGELIDTRTPTRIGEHLYATVLTATCPVGEIFASGQIYEYRLEIASTPSPDWSAYTYPAFSPKHPTFQGLPTTLTDLEILHGSCRRPHANRRDGLGQAHRILDDPTEARPHLLILTGDQIYADDVGSPLMALVQWVAEGLIGIDETALFQDDVGQMPLIAGRQSRSEAFSLTSEYAKDHLWTLGEFYSMYLLAWSEALWRAELPELDADRDAVLLANNDQQNDNIWAEELANLINFKTTVSDVQRALANIPTLMIFDDHETTDDSNLNLKWINEVYTHEQGARVMFNGTLAYLLFQHWGNCPERFDTGSTPEQQALAAAVWTGASPDSDDLRDWLGFPDPQELPILESALPWEMRDLTEETRIRYDFRLGPEDGFPCPLVVLDERTARYFPSADYPSGRVSKAALDLMWPAPLDSSKVEQPTILVASAPVLGLHIWEHVIQPFGGLNARGQEYFDFESWTACGEVFEYLLDRIAQYRQVIILSGDLHFGYTKKLTYWKPYFEAQPAQAAQFTASGAKYTTNLTLTVHWLGDLMTKLGMVRTRSYYGYDPLEPDQQNLLTTAPSNATLPYDDMVDIMVGRVIRAALESPAVFTQEVAEAYSLRSPDWRYTIAHVDDSSIPDDNVFRQLLQLPVSFGHWSGKNLTNSVAMVEALRASDLNRLGRVFVGLPLLARVTFEETPLVAKQEIFISAGDDEDHPISALTVSKVDLG